MSAGRGAGERPRLGKVRTGGDEIWVQEAAMPLVLFSPSRYRCPAGWHCWVYIFLCVFFFFSERREAK